MAFVPVLYTHNMMMMMMMMMMKLPILPCAEKLELVLSTAPKTCIFTYTHKYIQFTCIQCRRQDLFLGYFSPRHFAPTPLFPCPAATQPPKIQQRSAERILVYRLQSRKPYPASANFVFFPVEQGMHKLKQVWLLLNGC